MLAGYRALVKGAASEGQGDPNDGRKTKRPRFRGAAGLFVVPMVRRLARAYGVIVVSCVSTASPLARTATATICSVAAMAVWAVDVFHMFTKLAFGSS